MYAVKDMNETQCDSCLKKKLCSLTKFDDSTLENWYCAKCKEQQAGIRFRARNAKPLATPAKPAAPPAAVPAKPNGATQATFAP